MRLEFEITQEDFIAGQLLHAWRRYSPRLARFQKVTQPIFAVALLWVAFLAYRWKLSSTLVFLEAVCGLYLLLAPNVIAPFFYRRRYRLTREKDNRIALTISQESLHFEHPGRSVGTLQWPALLGVLDGPSSALLYLSPATFLIIPRRVLGDTMHDELLSMCKDRGLSFTYPKLKPTERG